MKVSEAMAVQLNYTHWVLKKNLEGITQEESLRGPKQGGNSPNWILGHLLGGRNGMLTSLGQEPIIDASELEPYQRGGSGLTTDSKVLNLPAMVELLDRSQEQILAALPSLDQRLGEKAPFSPVDNPDETMGSLMAGLVFHEAYHTGQTGVLRRIAGREGVLK